MDLFSFVKPKNELESKPDEKQKPFVPEEMWVKCPSCNQMLLTTDLQENLYVCTRCNHHFRISAQKRLDMLADSGSFAEFDAEMKSRIDEAAKQGVPITNYGTVLAKLNGILERSTEIVN